MEAWLWEKEQSHRLFNFHEGFRIDQNNYEIIGSSKVLNTLNDIVDIITRTHDGEFEVKPASKYVPHPKKP
jgi:Golgi nucleoside diphosphatase